MPANRPPAERSAFARRIAQERTAEQQSSIPAEQQDGIAAAPPSGITAQQSSRRLATQRVSRGTMWQKDLHEAMKVLAIRRGCDLADVLDAAVVAYLQQAGALPENIAPVIAELKEKALLTE